MLVMEMGAHRERVGVIQVQSPEGHWFIPTNSLTDVN